MRRPATTAGRLSSWGRSWAGSLLLALALLLSCTDGRSPAAGQDPPGNREAEAALLGWMGRFAQKDEGLRKLLEGQPAWALLRDMALLEAIQAFSSSDRPADRVGAARSCLAMADLFAAADGLFLEAEAAYLEALGAGADSGDRVRRAFVRLRLRDLAAAGADFAGPPPDGARFLWAVGSAGVKALEGKTEEARATMAAAPKPGSDGEVALAQVGCFLWGVPWEGTDKGPYGQALAAFHGGDLATGVMALDLLDFESSGRGAEPGLFLYPLFRRAFAGLAAAAAEGGDGVAALFLAGRAREHLGEWGAAAESYRRASEGSGNGAPGILFSPFYDLSEMARVARVLRGGALYRSGRPADAVELWRGVVAQDAPGALVLASLAAIQARLGATEPLGAPGNSAAAAVAASLAVAAGVEGAKGAEAVVSLHAAREAAVGQRAAEVYRGAREGRRAADLLERLHVKSTGYRASFVNPPDYLVDLARSYAAAGEYAPAVAVMFELAGEYPSLRFGYESLKRLYASRTGGDAPPR